MKVRQTICYGIVDWQIFRNELQNEYVFSGDTMQELAELSALKEDVVWSEAAARKIGDAKIGMPNYGLASGTSEFGTHCADCSDTLKSQYQYVPETKSSFINPRFSSETPQNEIRNGAYCFANLENIKPENREKAIEVIQSLASKYGGFVNKYDATDKGLIAIILFGIPKSADKTLDRICRFALKAVEEQPELALGIASGSVFAGYTGAGETREYTALGHPMNLAARLMSKARAGEILTDYYLFMELNQSYEFDLVGSIALKGISFPIKHYRLNHKAYQKTVVMESPFVGRDSEITEIRQVITDGLSSSRNSIIYVLGDAGIGKSRLIKEALAWYSEADCHKFFCYCDAILPKPGELIRQMLRTYFGYNFEQAADVGLAAFRSKWAALAQGDIELIRIESIIASLLGYEWQDSIWSILPPEEKPGQLQNAFISLLKTITTAKPVIIHLDDAQWIDAQSREYLQLLSDKEIAPVLIIAACRYLDNGEKPDLELVKHQSVSLDLNKLSIEGSRQLIQSLINPPSSSELPVLAVNAIPEATFSLINSRAMGNPFYIEQLVSYLQENGKLDTSGEIIGDVGEIGSFSISDIIGSRIDRLTENLRELVANASVLGMEFNVIVLSCMLNNDLKDGLEAGTSSRIWKDLDELRYIFSHILIKDVVYQRMLNNKLQKLHQAAAEAMEIIYADKLDEQAEEIALHFEKAKLSVQAARYFDKAGCSYRDNYDFSRAESNLDKALQIRENVLAAENPEIASSLNNIALLYKAQGKYEQAITIEITALDIREKLLGTEHENTSDSLTNLAMMYYSHGKYEQAEPLLLRAVEIKEKLFGVEHPEMAALLNNLSTLYYSQGKYEQVESLSLRAIAIYDNVYGVDHPEIVISLMNLARLYRNQGKYEQSELLFLRAIEIEEKEQGTDLPFMAILLDSLAGLYEYQGKDKQSESNYLRSLEIREKVLGAEHLHTAYASENLAFNYYFHGKYEQAEPLFLRAIGIYENTVGIEHPSTIDTISGLAELNIAMGTNQKNAKYASVLSHDYNPILNAIGKVHSHHGNYEKAECMFLRAIDIWGKSLGMNHPWTVDAISSLVMLYDKIGLSEKANQYKHLLYNIKN